MFTDDTTTCTTERTTVNNELRAILCDQNKRLISPATVSSYIVKCRHKVGKESFVVIDVGAFIIVVWLLLCRHI